MSSPVNTFVCQKAQSARGPLTVWLQCPKQPDHQFPATSRLPVDQAFLQPIPQALLSAFGVSHVTKLKTTSYTMTLF